MITCSCDMETYSPYVEREHRARKPTECSDCGGKIAKAELYLYHEKLSDLPQE